MNPDFERIFREFTSSNRSSFDIITDKHLPNDANSYYFKQDIIKRADSPSESELKLTSRIGSEKNYKISDQKFEVKHNSLNSFAKISNQNNEINDYFQFPSIICRNCGINMTSSTEYCKFCYKEIFENQQECYIEIETELIESNEDEIDVLHPDKFPNLDINFSFNVGSTQYSTDYSGQEYKTHRKNYIFEDKIEKYELGKDYEIFIECYSEESCSEGIEYIIDNKSNYKFTGPNGKSFEFYDDITYPPKIELNIGEEYQAEIPRLRKKRRSGRPLNLIWNPDRIKQEKVDAFEKYLIKIFALKRGEVSREKIVHIIKKNEYSLSKSVEFAKRYWEYVQSKIRVKLGKKKN